MFAIIFYVFPIWIIFVNQGGTGSVLESMDGCFGLVRKKSAGVTLIPSRHNLTMFADQNDVDNFVDTYTESAKHATVVRCTNL